MKNLFAPRGLKSILAATALLNLLPSGRAYAQDCGCGEGPTVDLEFDCSVNQLHGYDGVLSMEIVGHKTTLSNNNTEPGDDVIGRAYADKAKTELPTQIEQDGGEEVTGAQEVTVTVTTGGDAEDWDDDSACDGGDGFATFKLSKACGWKLQIYFAKYPDLTPAWHDATTAKFHYYISTHGSITTTIPIQIRLKKAEDEESDDDAGSGEEENNTEPDIPEESQDVPPALPGGQPDEVHTAGFGSVVPLNAGSVLEPGSEKTQVGSITLSGPMLPSTVDIAKLKVFRAYGDIPGPFEMVMSGGSYRQVRTHGHLADIVSISGGGIEIRSYVEGQFNPTPPGGPGTLFTINGGAVAPKIVRYMPVAAVSGHFGGIQVTNFSADSATRVREVLSTSADGLTWRVVRDGAVSEDYSSVFEYVDGVGLEPGKWTRRTEKTETRNSMVCYNRTLLEEYQVRRAGSPAEVVESHKYPLVERVATNSSPGDDLVTTRVPDPVFLGRDKHVTHPDGSWEVYKYYTGSESGAFLQWRGMVKEVLRPWNGAPATPTEATTSNSESTLITYTPPDESGMSGFEAVSRITSRPSVGRVRRWEKAVSGVSTANLIIRLTNAGVDSNWVYALFTNLKDETSKEFASSGEAIFSHSFVYAPVGDALSFVAGKTCASIDAEGDGSVTCYEKGTFNATSGEFTPDEAPFAPTGDHVRVTTLAIANFSARPVDNEATKKVVIEDQNGRRKREELWVGPSGNTWSLATFTTFEYPSSWPDGSPKQVIAKQNGRIISELLDVSGTETAEWDAQGIETHTVRDAQGRVSTVTREGIGSQPDLVTTYIYNGLTTTAVTSGGTLSQSRVTVKDLAGRTVSETSPSEAVTTTAYPNGGRNIETTFPGGAKRVVTRNIDGNIVTITGAAVVDEAFTYTAQTGGIIETTHRVGDLVTSPRYTITRRDWAGRERSVTTPSPTGSGTTDHAYTYQNGTRNIIATSSAAGMKLVARPDILSSSRWSGIDLDGSGTLSLSSPDRVTASSTRYVLQGGFWWQESLQSQYDMSGNGASAITTSSKRCLHGNPSGDASWAITTSPSGGTEEVKTTVNRSTRTLTTTVVRSGISTPAVSVDVNGWLVSHKGHDSAVATSWDHDAFGRVLREVSPRGAVTRKTWYSSGPLHTATDHTGKTTTYAYYGPSHISAGKVMSVTNPLGKSVTYSYSPLGDIGEEAGDAGYKVTYGYDDYGVKNKMWTWRDAVTSDLTEWIYQAGTGLLLQKKDAAGKAVTHTYSSAGKPATRTSARNITTTYGYDTITGDLTSINYSDSTPDITLSSHDRIGRPGLISQTGIGSETLVYHSGKGATFERYNSSGHTLLPGIGIRYPAPDAQERPMGFTETLNGTTVRTVGYGYSASSGLLATITDGGQNHTYAYQPNSSLVSTIHSNAGSTAWFRQSRYHDSGGRLVGIRSDRMTGSSVLAEITSHAYDHDALGRRVKNTFQDGSSWHYDYNDRSEVTGATRKTPGGTEISELGASYGYDGIGNRLTSTSPVLGDRTYTPNGLNQYSAITTGSTRNAIGRAPLDWNILVAGGAADRTGEIFYRELSASNTSAPVWQDVVVQRDTGTPTFTQHFWYSQQNTSPAHDDDGNLTNDGRWTYVWDAENRLTQMESTTAATTAGHPYTKLQFAYDWEGRRIARHVWQGGTSGSPVFKSSHRWLSDKWNQITEFTAPSASSTTLTHANVHTWGLDLGDTDGIPRQRAGGVGGLLAINTPSASTIHAASYDGNGNIVAWTRSDLTAPASRREYDAFGNTLVSEGTAPSSFGFSTKPQDYESGLYYYGYRYYDPVTGRWPSRDPIGERGGVNQYSFLENEVTSGFDVLGMCKSDPNGYRVTAAGVDPKPIADLDADLPKVKKRDFDDTSLEQSWGSRVTFKYQCCICKAGKYSWGGDKDESRDEDSGHKTRADALNAGWELLQDLRKMVTCP